MSRYIIKVETEDGNQVLQRGITEAMFLRLKGGEHTNNEKKPRFQIATLDLAHAKDWNWATAIDEGDQFVSSLELAVAVGVTEQYVNAQNAKARTGGKSQFTIRGVTLNRL